jgi:hypothetical protein
MQKEADQKAAEQKVLDKYSVIQRAKEAFVQSKAPKSTG